MTNDLEKMNGQEEFPLKYRMPDGTIKAFKNLEEVIKYNDENPGFRTGPSIN